MLQATIEYFFSQPLIIIEHHRTSTHFRMVSFHFRIGWRERSPTETFVFGEWIHGLGFVYIYIYTYLCVCVLYIYIYAYKMQGPTPFWNLVFTSKMPWYEAQGLPFYAGNWNGESHISYLLIIYILVRMGWSCSTLGAPKICTTGYACQLQ